MRALALLPLLGGCQLIFQLDEPGPQEPHLFTRTIHVTQTSGQAHIDFPLSVVLDRDGGLLEHAATDGSDIRLFDETLTTELPSEVSYDGTNGTLDAWVRIADFKTEPFDILLVYGDGTPRSALASDTWSAAFVGVWHLSEDSGNAIDSTSHMINLSAGSGTAPVTMAGSVGKARSFDGVMDRLCAVDPMAASFIAAPFSFGVWTQISAGALTHPPLQVVDKGTVSSNKKGWGLEVEGNGVIAFAGDGTQSPFEAQGAPPVVDRWEFRRVQVQRGGNLSLFVNGSAVISQPIGGLGTLDPPDAFCLGGPTFSRFDGVLDEVRIYNGIQTPQWINAEYANVQERDSFMSIGEETPR